MSRRGGAFAYFRLILYRHMARDEMDEITSDRWDSDLWGIAKPKDGCPRPKLFFYFGKDDRWVADHTRDELIAARGYREGGGEEWKPRMLVDEEGITHDFCLSESGSWGCLDVWTDCVEGIAEQLRRRLLVLWRISFKLIRTR